MPLPELNPEVIEKLILLGRPPSAFDDEFTKCILEKMSDKSSRQPSREHPALDKSELAKLKYSMLVQIIKQAPKAKLPISMEVSVIHPKEIQDELLNEKLVEIEDDKLKVSDTGRRFMADFEKDQVKEK